MNNLLVPNIAPVQPNIEIGSRSIDKNLKGDIGFEKILRGNLATDIAPKAMDKSSLKFSAHAMNRIKDRSIDLGKDLMGKLERAVDTAQEKGAKESLILSKDAAFIVSIKNKTVITVLDRNQMDGNVFTNIDSTVVI